MNIKISDRTLCGGANSFSFKEKIEIARQLEKLCVDTVEFPEIENIKTDTLLIRTVSSFVKEGVISVAAGMTEEGVKNAVNALQIANKKRIRVELPVSTVGMEYTCHKKAPKMVELVAKLVKLAKESCEDVEFCAIDATRAEEDVLVDMINSAVEAGATKVTVCDTAAEMMPEKFAKFVSKINDILNGKDVELGVMCSDKNGLAAANAMTAVGVGAQIIKTNVGKEITSLETVVGIIKNCGSSCGFSSNVKYTELNRIINQINWITVNAKNEKSAVTVNDSYENGIELDANDDRDAVITAVLKLGYDLSEEDSQKVYEEFLNVAAKKKVGVKELDAIVASVALQVPPTYKLKSYVLNSGNIISATAQITLEKDGGEINGISIGDGPIDAAFLAIEQIIGCHYELDDFQIQSVTEGKQALGSALVKLRSNGKLYSGNGISTDIIGASIRAYISAVNKIVYEEANI